MHFTYKEKEYEFRLSNKAKIEIEKQRMAIFKKPEIVSALASINDEQEGQESQDKTKIIATLAPYLDELSNDDPFEIGFILLKNDIRYKDEMTRDLWEEIVSAVEIERGIEEMHQDMVEVVAEVFMVMERMNKLENEKLKRVENKLEVREMLS